MLGVCGRMKGGGSCEMMKSWRENDVAKIKAAQRPKSVNYLGNGTHCLRQTQGGNEERRGSTYGDRVWGLGGPVVQVSLREIGNAQKKTNHVRHRLKRPRRLVSVIL